MNLHYVINKHAIKIALKISGGNFGNLIEIVSLEHMEGEVEVVNFDVEPLDIYFAGGVLVHNKGASSEP